MTRRDWFRLAAGGAVGTGAYVFAESRWFEVSHTPMRMRGLIAPVRALHLADLHSSYEVPTPLLNDAVSAGLAQKPDIVFLTGDYISTFRHFDEQGLRAIFRQLSKSAPTYAVMGNHDNVDESTEYLREMLTSAGVHLLHNASEIAVVNGQKLEIAGLGDLWNKVEFDPRAAFSEFSGRDYPSIVLAHNPDTKDAIAHENWDLMLSGHTHGGQVCLPFVKTTWAPVADQRYLEGLHAWSGRQLYITRGVGSHKGIRFRCRPEVSILNLGPTVEIT